MDHAVELIDWLPYSPDLNPIEYVLKKLKQLVTEMHPEIRYLKKNNTYIALLNKWNQEAWKVIDQSCIDNLIRLVPRRLREC